MSGGAKRPRFLSPNWISELVWDSEIEEKAASDSMSEDKGGFQDERWVSHLQPELPTSSGQASSSLFSTSASDGFQSGSGQKLYMDDYFLSPDLFDYLAMKQIYSCGTVRLNRKGVTLQQGDLQVRTRADLKTILWMADCFFTFGS